MVNMSKQDECHRRNFNYSQGTFLTHIGWSASSIISSSPGVSISCLWYFSSRWWFGQLNETLTLPSHVFSSLPSPISVHSGSTNTQFFALVPLWYQSLTYLAPHPGKPSSIYRLFRESCFAFHGRPRCEWSRNANWCLSHLCQLKEWLAAYCFSPCVNVVTTRRFWAS